MQRYWLGSQIISPQQKQMSSVVQSTGTVKRSAFNFTTQVNLANSQDGKKVKTVIMDIKTGSQMEVSKKIGK